MASYWGRMCGNLTRVQSIFNVLVLMRSFFSSGPLGRTLGLHMGWWGLRVAMFNVVIL